MNIAPEYIEQWEKIIRFQVDEGDPEYAFTDRLALENGWPLEYTLRVFYEYKKFIFLLCIQSESLTPSDAVDQAWHLHLIYTRSYWDRWCENILNKRIHHGPTQGEKKKRINIINCINVR